MGGGIAQTAAQFELDVCLMDMNPDVVTKAMASLDARLGRLVQKEKISTEQKSQILGRVRPIENWKDLGSCDLVVEAISEREDWKFELFQKLDEVTSKEAILCSNTSSISITRIASKTSRPEKVAGMHFMNPVPVMKLVEGIRGHLTSDETFSTVRSLAEKMGKTFVEAQDFPGFIVNRILMPMINEAVYTLYEGVASVEDIDAAMKLGTNQPMGPLTLADFIGLDTCLAIMNVLHDGLGDSKYRPCPLLKRYVDAGLLGKKSGRGFYSY